MGLLLNEGLRVDSRKLEADALAGVNGQVQVFLDLVHVHVLLVVECAQINGAFNRDVYELGQHEAILH